MRTLLQAFAVILIAVLIPCGIAAPMAPHEDVPIGSLPSDSVIIALRKTLSPQGRFVILAPTGVVRIFDTPEKMEAARKALEALQNAPSIVSFTLNFKIGLHQVTHETGEGPVDYEIPVPNTYSAPQVVGQGGNRIAVIPSQPGNFTVRHAAPGDHVYANPGYTTGGYVTGSEVRMQSTGWEGGRNHKLTGSTNYPKAISVSVCAKVDNPQGLHDWAVKAGAIPASEPAWASATTEILVTPERAENGLLLNLTPEIVLPAVTGQPARRIPLKICSASVLTKPGTSASLEALPGADAEFYKLFFNAQESAENTATQISAAAGTEYLTPAAGQ